LTHGKNTKRKPNSGFIEWELDEDGMIVVRGRAITETLQPVDLGFAKLPGWEAAGELICGMIRRHARAKAYGAVTPENEGGRLR
jgi:hypothetical protein